MTVTAKKNFQPKLFILGIFGTPHFHTDPLSLTQGQHLFSTQNPSVQHRKPVRSRHSQ